MYLWHLKFPDNIWFFFSSSTFSHEIPNCFPFPFRILSAKLTFILPASFPFYPFSSSIPTLLPLLIFSYHLPPLSLFPSSSGLRTLTLLSLSLVCLLLFVGLVLFCFSCQPNTKTSIIDLWLILLCSQLIASLSCPCWTLDSPYSPRSAVSIFLLPIN